MEYWDIKRCLILHKARIVLFGILIAFCVAGISDLALFLGVAIISGLKEKRLKMKKTILLLAFIILPVLLQAQEIVKKNDYVINEDGKLQFTVHIWGEVRNPGEYLVPDKTDLLELISKAGGPTEYSNLNNVKITRGLISVSSDRQNFSRDTYYSASRQQIESKRIEKINLQKILEKSNYYQLLPVLKPGDVVQVGKNNWYRWQTVIRVVSQLAIVAQVWWYWNRN